MVLTECCLANCAQDHIMRLVNDSDDSDDYTKNDKHYSLAVNGIYCFVTNQHLETQLTDTAITLSHT